MEFDPGLALRLLTNARLRNAQGWCEYRDLGGALAAISDAPIPELNALGDFHSDERRIESLLDLGFALLRAFDREPAVELSPLDRPRSLERRLRRRGLQPQGSRTWMLFCGDADSIRTPGDISVNVAEPEDARTFAQIHGGGEAWVKRLSLASTLDAIHDERNTFYLAKVEDQPCGVLHLLIDGATAGIYAVATLTAYRRRGVSSTLMARAIRDAQRAGADAIGLSTTTGGYAEQLYTRLGFEPAFQTSVWSRE